ncbi:MAG TPA: tripartite tricarboxylate transporter substrate binding protein [Burkholderiaceae bacterium]|nr:tripartite tricarboxylate transporter substrate binding protein [Burkholderiaceae bacterium]
MLHHLSHLRRRLLSAGGYVAVAALAVATFAAPVQADSSYPNKPITIVVPYSPGSASDTTARIISEKLGPRLNVPVVVENKPGASGTIGAAQVGRAHPDGYTFVLTSSSTHSATPALFRNLPFDPTEDFKHVIRMVTIPMMLVVRADAPYQSAADLIKASKTRPLNYAYGSSTSQIAGATFNKVSGAEANGVPYKSQPPAVTDLLGGHVDYLFADLSVITQLIQDGRLRALAFTDQTRSTVFPDVPTMQELGHPFDLVVWVGLAAPAKTPDAAVERLNAEITEILRDPAVAERFQSLGMKLAPNTVAEHRDFTLQQRKIWTQRAVDAGIEAQ